jgi:hypothetical protein
MGCGRYWKERKSLLSATIYLELKRNKITGGRWSFYAPEPVALKLKQNKLEKLRKLGIMFKSLNAHNLY